MIPGRTYAPSDFLAMASRYKWLLVIPPVIGLFCALVVSSRMPDEYQSDMLISIVPQRVPDSFVQSTVTMRIEERLDAISQQLKSRTGLESLIDEFNLYPDLRASRQIDDVVAVMRQEVQVELEAPRRGPRGFEPAHAFRVRFRYTDPEVATRVVNKLGTLFVDRNVLERGALAEATDDFLQSQLREARTRLEAQEAKVEEFRKRHGNELPTQLESNMQAIQSSRTQLQALTESMARDRDRKLMLERLYNDAANEPAVVLPTPPAPTSGDPTPAVTGSVTQRLEAARANVARLELRLKPDHPDMRRARREMSDLEKLAASEAAAPEDARPVSVSTPDELARRERLRQMRAEIESLDRQLVFKQGTEERLNDTIALYQRRLEAVPGLESEWTALNRDYATLNQSYQTLLQKSEASRLAVNLEDRQIGEQFRVLDEARVPLRPVGPMRLQISLAGFGGGLVLGAALVLLLVLKDSSLRSEADVFQSLSLPVLATIPLVEVAADVEAARRRRMLVSGAAALAVAAGAYVTWALRLWKFVA